MDIQRSLPFPEDLLGFHTPDDFEHHAIAERAENISRPVRSVSAGIMMHLLINGKDRKTKRLALVQLFSLGRTPECIAKKLRSWAVSRPKDFLPDEIHELLQLIDVVWREKERT